MSWTGAVRRFRSWLDGESAATGLPLGALLATALALLERPDPTRERDAAGGALLGVSLLFRYRMALAVVPVLAWLAWRSGADGRRGWERAAAGFVLGHSLVGHKEDRFLRAGAWALTVQNRLLLAPPAVAGAAGYTLIYAAEPGYRVMARALRPVSGRLR